MKLSTYFSLSVILSAVGVSAHTVAWVKGMYCLNGAQAADNPNNNLAVNPLYNLSKTDWWFQHDRGCDAWPPSSGNFLNLPANGNITVELAHNRAQTTLSYNGQYTSDWPDGQQHPDNWNAPAGQCLSDGALHCSNQSTAYGSAFAISYQSSLSAVTMENLVVFTTLAHTPWKRLATYQIPDLPACPSGGCTCAWLWVPNGCGEPNIYMAGYKCNVTNAKSTKKVGAAKAPTWCPNNAASCVKGPKQMIAWNQASGNNVQVPAGSSPGYNTNMGYMNGAQTDIFV